MHNLKHIVYTFSLLLTAFLIPSFQRANLVRINVPLFLKRGVFIWGYFKSHERSVNAYVLWNITRIIKTVQKYCQNSNQRFSETEHTAYCFMLKFQLKELSMNAHNNYSFMHHRSKYRPWISGLSYRVENEGTRAANMFNSQSQIVEKVWRSRRKLGF
jgi:hypothetical protein